MSQSLSKAEYLIKAIQELSMARNIETIQSIVKHAARELVNSDGATFILRDHDLCYYADEDAISPLWKGKRFDMGMCISGWVMLNKQTAVIEDIYQDSRIPVDAYRATFVKSLVIVPIRVLAPIGAIGNYWKSTYTPTKEEIHLLEALANSTSIAIENVNVYSQLEERVNDRTAQLKTMNAELEAFSYSVSHDLRAPLRIIDGFSQMIKQDRNNQLSAESLDLFSRIETNVQRMNHLIDDLLMLSKITQHEVEKCAIDISLMAHEILSEYKRNNSGRNIVINIEDSLKVNGDPKLIRILLENILGNAIKYTAKNATTEITVGKFKQDEEEGIFIKDNGVGFRVPEGDEVFRPFRRYHTDQEFPGTGIGLAIVSRIVNLHNGALWPQSQPNEGATFYFYLR